MRIAPFRCRPAVLWAPLLCALALPCAAALPPAQEEAAAAGSAREGACRHERPRELLEVVKVVDGDTLHVRRAGAIEKLRLLSVDTEERFTGQPSDWTKPQTVFGEECALWAQELFAELAPEGEPPRVGLEFPEGEVRDVYGRLLCQVILPDGRDFNLLLVELGKSPYFNKYGNSLSCHAAFVAAQRGARERGLGIWDAEVNLPATPGAPGAVRPYDLLLPWWQARAEAIEGYRARRAEDPAGVAHAEDPASLARAAQTSARGEEVEVFGSIDRLFDERSGDLTVLFRAGDRERALRVRIPAGARPAFEPLGLERLSDEFRQNHVWVRGRLADTGRGFQMRTPDPGSWRVAEPEPAYPGGLIERARR